MTFRWATVTALSPLRIRLDGDDTSLPFTPESLLDPLSLGVGDRVRCEMSRRRILIHGRSGGDFAAAFSAYAIGVARANRARNGDCRINQRGYASASALAPQQYGPDGWCASGLANRIRNPRAGTNTTDWAGYITAGAISRVASGGPLSDAPTFFRFTASAAGNVGVYIAESVNPMRAGAPYVISFYVRCSVALTAQVSLQGYSTASGGTAGTSVSQNTAIAANTWTRISMSFTQQPGYPFVRIHLSTTGTNVPINGTFDWSAGLLTEGTVLHDYFDGAMTGCMWSGTAHASTAYNIPAVGSITLPASIGGTATLSSGMRVFQAIERARGGSLLLDWVGTATGRIYKASTALAARPAFQSAPLAFVDDGLDDLIVEFQASGGTKTLGDVQLIYGSKQQPFVPRHYQEELALCQRYFYRLDIAAAAADLLPLAVGQCYTTNGITFFPVRLPVPMRTAPVQTFSGSVAALRAHQRGIAIAIASAVSALGYSTTLASEWSITHSAAGFVNAGTTLVQTVTGNAAQLDHDAELRVFAA